MTHTQERVTTAVRMLMAAQRLKQSDLAAALGISQPSVSAKLAGRARWSVDDLDKLASTFGVALADLVSPPLAYAGSGMGLTRVTDEYRRLALVVDLPSHPVIPLPRVALEPGRVAA